MGLLGNFRPKTLVEPCLADFLVLCVDFASRNVICGFFQQVPDVMQAAAATRNSGVFSRYAQ